MINSHNFINPLILIVLLTLGRFISKSIRCDTKRQFSEYSHLRNFIIFIFIALSLTIRQDNVSSISKQLIYAVKIWLFTMIFIKLNIYFITAVLCFLLISVLIRKKIKFNVKDEKNNNEPNKHEKENNKIKKLAKIFEFLAIFILLVGYGYSLYVDKVGWNINNYMFGTQPCQIN